MTSSQDAFFSIGRGHHVCQDYARSGRTTEGRSYAIVSDGCSSSPDTDVGARLITLAAEAQLRRGELPEPVTTGALLGSSVEVMGLHPNAADATMIAALECDRHIAVRMWGDGLIVARRRRDASLVVVKVDQHLNAPRYLSYSAHSLREASYLEIFGSLHDIGIFDSVTGETRSVLGNQSFPLPDWQFSTEDCDLVAILSDGVCSFQETVESETSRQSHEVSFVQVLQELLAFKSFNGAFAQRRGRSFLTKTCVAKKWQHIDDIALGVVWVGEP